MKQEPQFNAIEKLIASAPYGVPSEIKRSLFLSAMHEAYRHHFASCPAFRRFCERRSLTLDSIFSSLEEIPFLPVQAFKEYSELLQSAAASMMQIKLQSSATSGIPSTVYIDKITAKRQVRALGSVLSETLGPKRRPLLVVDLDPAKAHAPALGARGAAVRGFLNIGREAQYFIGETEDGQLAFLQKEFSAALEQYATNREPIILLGFTYVLYLFAVLPLYEAGKRFHLPEGSFVIHIGGWKKLEDRKVQKDQFNTIIAEVFGIPTSSVIDFYGFTEQMGITYPDSPEGLKHAPSFAEVIVRDPVSFKPLPDGQIGILQFLTPLPHSYPGISILTDDLGIIVGRGPSKNNWHGTQFRVLGRAKKAEVRGCGDIMSEKVDPKKPRSMTSPNANQEALDLGVRLLFDSEGTHVGRDLFTMVNLQQLPKVQDLSTLAQRLLEGRKALDRYTVDELIALIAEAARKWILPDSSVAPLRQNGLLFLSNWCRSPALRQMADRSMRGARGHLDGFRGTEGSSKRMILAQSRGLVAHWLAGNVPLLGMLTLVQGILTRNANLLKSASTFASPLPLLLDSFRDLEVRLPTGKILYGNDILKSIAVVYFARENKHAAETLSSSADLRLAWGGREAVESIMNLPKRFGTEDIIFGPKLSYMAIGKEYLSTERLAKKLARLAATDASVFDQYACASPHTIFVETGAAYSPHDFSIRLAQEMERALIRIPKQLADAGTVGAINSVRMRHEFTGELWSSKGSEWTVILDEKGPFGLADPCYSRVITIKPINDILEAAQFAHKGIQTIGLALDGARRLRFAEKAAGLGAERFPDIGRMTFFDSPWDGLYPMDRMVRWVTLGGPQ